MTRDGEKGESKAKRRGPGRPIRKGQVLNPTGRPKKDWDLVTRCRELSPAIIERYAVMGAQARNAAEVLAGRVVLEYGHDKPRQRTEITGPNGGPLIGGPVILRLPGGDGMEPATAQKEPDAADPATVDDAADPAA